MNLREKRLDNHKNYFYQILYKKRISSRIDCHRHYDSTNDFVLKLIKLVNNEKKADVIICT